MKYQVILNNKVLSTHKSRDLADRAMNRWMRKHTKERLELKAKYGWLDSKIAKNVSGVYSVRAV